MKKLLVALTWLTALAANAATPLENMLAYPTPTVGQSMNLSGRDSAADGGGGLFSIVADVGQSTNLGTVFRFTSDLTKLAVRQDVSRIDVRWFGAHGGGVTDDTAALQAAINYVTNDALAVVLPKGTYRTTTTLWLHPRMKFGGTAPEQGNLWAFTNTVVRLDHVLDGFALDAAYAEGAGVELSNMRVSREPTFGTSASLINWSNIKGGVLHNLYGYHTGIGSLGLTLSNSFFNSTKGFKLFAEDVGSKCINLLYPSTVNEFENGMVQSTLGSGVYCESQNNSFRVVNFEFSATGFELGSSLAGGTCSGTAFNGCHFEMNTVAHVDATDQPEVDMVFNACYFVDNGGGSFFLTTNGRDYQNMIIIGRHEPFNSDTAYHMAKLGVLDISTSPHATGAQVYFDGVTSDATSYIEFNFFKNNTATGNYLLTLSHPTATNFLQFSSADYGSMIWNHPDYGDILTYEGTYGGRMQLGSHVNDPRFGVGGAAISQLTAIGTNAILSLQSKATNGSAGIRFYDTASGNPFFLLQDMWLGDVWMGTPLQSNAFKMAYNGEITLTDTLTLDSTLVLPNATGVRSKVYGSSASIPVIHLDTNNAVVIASGGDATVVGGSLSVTGAVTVAGLPVLTSWYNIVADSNFVLTTNGTNITITLANNIELDSIGASTVWFDGLTDADTNKLIGVGYGTNLVPATEEMTTNSAALNIKGELALLAPKASPTFTGTATVPTAAITTAGFGSGLVTNNIGIKASTAAITFLDAKAQGERDIEVTDNIVLAHATNGVAGETWVTVVNFSNYCGANKNLTIPTGWRTNMLSAVPPALTNGTVTTMYVAVKGATGDAASQTNAIVRGFEYYK